MRIEKITVGGLFSNCWLLTSGESAEAVLIDPGAEAGRILNAVKAQECIVKYIIATHGHIDHISAIPELLSLISPPPPVCIHSADEGMLEDSDLNLAGFAGIPFEHVKADTRLEEGSIIKAGGISLEILHTPGHTPGGICLLGGNSLFTGDTLFADGIGRTDLPGGSSEALLKSINERLLPMDENTKIFPGHGPESTIGRERKSLSEWI
jgi:hydroxyacylglutathione hydrolase